MATRRRTQFKGIDPLAVRELVGLQEDLSGDTDQLRAEALGATTGSKTASGYHAGYNQRVRVKMPTAGGTVSFPPANSASQNKWIEILHTGGGNIKIVPTTGKVQGATSFTLTAPGSYYFQSDGLDSWWVQPTGGGGLTSPVAFADIQTIGANTWLGNITGAVAAITANTLAQLKTYIGNMSAGVAGLAPPGSGVAAQFLNGNGAYAVPAGGAPVGAAQTLLGNPTGAAAADVDIAVGTESVVGRSSGNVGTFASAVQSCLIRAAGSLFFASAAAGQHLRRSLAGGDLGFSALEVGALGTPIVANVTATAALTNLSCTGAQTLAAGAGAIGTTLLFAGWFIFVHTAAAMPTLTAEILVNGAVVATAILTPISGVAATFAGRIDGVLTIRTTGTVATGTAIAQVHFDSDLAAANSVDGSVGTATFAIDTTVARTMELRIRMSSAVASNTLTVTNGYIRRIS